MRFVPPGSLLLCALLAAGFGRAASDPVTLVNDHIEVGIDPSHGLILGFGSPGGANLLWVNPHPLSSARHAGWINYGGDKLWWGPLSEWQVVRGRLFPPDEALDGAWETVTCDRDSLVMRSNVSPWVGVRAERKISLAPGRAGLIIHNRFSRVQASPQPLQLWTVCQLPPPRWCWLDCQPEAGEAPFVNLRPDLDPKPFTRHENETGLVRCMPSPERTYMIGTRGAWIAAVYDDRIIVHEIEPDPDGDYPEQVSLQMISTTDYI